MFRWADCNENKVGVLEFEQVRVEIDLEKVEQKLPVKGELVQCLGEIKVRIHMYIPKKQSY